MLVKALRDVRRKAVIKGHIYQCIGEENGKLRVIDESDYVEDETLQGSLLPRNTLKS